MKPETEAKIRADLASMRKKVALIDEVVGKILKQRRLLRRKINIAECRLQRAGKEK